ncbi:MAG: NYN domain-containing protein [Nitrosospira sp.]|nr:NYN domain-containing protein [Nitrosospira sp.]
MASPPENISMAVFCDFENVALGVRDAQYERFDIKLVLERLLLKGSIVIKKAYCDWDRYKAFKSTMHEANFELIEIPHIRQSGKNSADIRLVVDALDLCYTKSHVNTFVIISGDSDFSPLVSKLRENAKQVIGVGVKKSTSDLLIANCDEFIFYDDLVREIQRAAAKRDTREAQPAAKRLPDGEKRPKEELEARKSQAIDMTLETFEALVSERGDSGKIWASALKQAIKRRKPDFNESYYGFRAFGNLLEEAQARGLLELGRDEKSGTYVFRNGGALESAAAGEPSTNPALVSALPQVEVEAGAGPATAEETSGGGETRRRRGLRKAPPKKARTEKAETALPQGEKQAPQQPGEAAPGAAAAQAAPKGKATPAAQITTEPPTEPAPASPTPSDGPDARDVLDAPGTPAKAAAKTAPKTATRRRRSRKPETPPGEVLPTATEATEATEE